MIFKGAIPTVLISPKNGGDGVCALGGRGPVMSGQFSSVDKYFASNTLRFLRSAIQQSIAVYRGDTVTIEERLDGTIHLRLKDTYLSFAPIGKLERAARPCVTALTR